jgi:hypothetical protein
VSYQDWEEGVRERAQHVHATGVAASRWIAQLAFGESVAIGMEESIQREFDMEDAASAWVSLVEWWRKKPSG